MTGKSANLDAARQYAQRGQFPQMLAQCQIILDAEGQQRNTLLDVGVLLLTFGFLSQALRCFAAAQALSPADYAPTVNMANALRDMGQHAKAKALYTKLLALLPQHPVIRRNALTSLEYDPHSSDAQRLAHAREWGQWAISRSGGPRPRPALRPLHHRPLRLGYVSADFCQHTAGLFVKEVMKAHHTQGAQGDDKVQVFVYSAGHVQDWVTDEIRATCQFCDVSALDDAALACRIQQDNIDVLVDLSGHTGGSRLTAFAYRPAPVMVSWLGYFATTGLEYMDAVLLDQWHAPPGTEELFVEPVIRLPSGRFCYQPALWAPDALPMPPFRQQGHITFGCFNNTAKINDSVLDVWAAVLHAVPHSRLILKWRSFNDVEFCHTMRQAFAQRGIAADDTQGPTRVELRGPSFHADVLQEYAHIDIALDPFPFTGGLTTCEALWMGVPVITWPQSRAVSRQSCALLHQIGLPQLVASSAEDYVRIAAQLAGDGERLQALRSSLREQMRASPLMDTAGFTKGLENCLVGLYERIADEART